MNPSIKRQWIKALRSGSLYGKEIKQCFGGLRIGDSYCPLGILCKLHQHDCHITERHWRPSSSGIESYTYMYESFPHENVIRWASLTDLNPFLTLSDGRVKSIAHINDVLKLPFPKIADLIEEQL